jgi:hypothetical protein
MSYRILFIDSVRVPITAKSATTNLLLHFRFCYKNLIYLKYMKAESHKISTVNPEIDFESAQVYTYSDSSLGINTTESYHTVRHKVTQILQDAKDNIMFASDIITSFVCSFTLYNYQLSYFLFFFSLEQGILHVCNVVQ